MKQSSSISRSVSRQDATLGGRAIPPQLLLGAALIAAAWPISWWGPRPITDHAFFPLWLGYILTVDGLVLKRAGTSFLSRNRCRFTALFLISAPIWWLFEAANHFLDNWHYLLAYDYGFWTYHLLASIAFSTVLPAVFETAEFYRTTRLGSRFSAWLIFHPSTMALLCIAAVGGLSFLGALAFPRFLFPIVWLGLFFLLDPINRLRGRPSLAAQVAQGRWDTVVILFAAGITCGFFWEMWNYWAMPKWIYELPAANRPKLFEMPLLGYGGYLPFALELYAIYHAGLGLFGIRWDDFLHFDKQLH